MGESVIFPSEKTLVKLGTLLIETLLSGDPLYYSSKIKGHFIYISFSFFDHIRTSITKSTL